MSASVVVTTFLRLGDGKLTKLLEIFCEQMSWFFNSSDDLLQCWLSYGGVVGER